MKTILSSLICLIVLNIQAQISTSRMGDIYIGKRKADVEKVIGQKIITEKEDGYYDQKAEIHHKGVDYLLTFIDGYVDGEEAVMLYEISTTSTKIKTISGMGVGNTLEDLWKTYKNYTIELVWSWDMDREQFSKTERIFKIYDYDNATVLQFLLKNDKVYQIRIYVYEGC